MNGLQFIAPMIVLVTAILTIGGVIILRPLSKRVAELLHAMSQEKLSATGNKDMAQVRELLATMESRLSLLEERQSFSEALLDASRRPGTAELSETTLRR